MPAKGFTDSSKQKPIQMPTLNESITCRVMIASAIASSGGRIDIQFASYIV
jgi:hypothetical protein